MTLEQPNLVSVTTVFWHFVETDILSQVDGLVDNEFVPASKCPPQYSQKPPQFPAFQAAF